MVQTWEREHKPLKEIIKLEDYIVISNVHQRKGVGGRPAIIANKKKFHVQNLTEKVVRVPWGVEAVWCALTPKNITNDSRIQKIICCSIYSKPNSRKKSKLLDHISETYNFLGKKYGRGVYFILAGDTNDLNLKPILSLSPSMQQIVKDWTRLDPPAILDPIMTTLSNLYQKPVCLDPLDSDEDKDGVSSDHRIVLCKPINVIENKCSRQTKVVSVRPMPESGIERFREWLIDYDWSLVYKTSSAHEKAKTFQNILMEKFEDIFPVKQRKIQSDDQPWFTAKLKRLDRKRKRIYRKERRSERWKHLDNSFKIEQKTAKSNFYK